MWIKLILFLIAAACTAAGFMQKRSSVLTDESKRILDIFDFSNFDKQEALSYIDRQRFENLIRGKRSKWNLIQNMLKSNLNPGGCAGGELSDGEPIANDDKLEQNSRSDFDENEDNYLEPSLFGPVKHVIRTRNARKTENTKKKDSEMYKDSNSSSAELNDNQIDENGRSEELQKQGVKKKKKSKRHHWSKWTEWSPCSVTCGKGRKIRSRRCIAKSCTSGELEMGEKTCQLPACSLFDKLFNFFT